MAAIATALVQLACFGVLILAGALVLSLVMEAARRERERAYREAVRRLMERDARSVGNERRREGWL